MKARIVLAAVLLSSAGLPDVAAQQPKPLSDDKYIELAASGGPPTLTAGAKIVRLSADGSMATVREGSNDITCFAGFPGDPDNAETPLCGDPNAITFMVDLLSGKPAPTNTVPGIAYMAKGGYHREKPNGDIVMQPEAGTRAVKEPAHWMVMYPVDAETSGLATRENPTGVYIMFAGTPWAHLMVYQDPSKMYGGKMEAERPAGY